jgi:4-hydroxy-tetrahydrodipicolinate synthase
MQLRGCGTALVTPFSQDGAVDEKALRNLVGWQVESGIDFLIPCGTTGETPTLNHDEWLHVIDVTIEVVAGRVPIVAGATSNSTQEAVAKAKEVASRPGVNAILTASPYYNKPTQEGQYRHFRKIAEMVDLPMILYNVPGRTVADMQNDTVMRLAQVPGIIGIKDATANIERGTDLVKRAPKGFAIYSGEDSTALALILLGGHGVISVTANVAPRLMHEMCSRALAGDVKTSREINLRLLGLHQRLFVEANPIPVKWALAQMGLIEPGIRLPMTPLADRFHETVRGALHEAGIRLAEGLRVVEGRA